ncbi:MAG: hypothetical protein RL708_2576 [Bacteroidota bacterium]|jgi:sugar lactone lactonase YvrE
MNKNKFIFSFFVLILLSSTNFAQSKYYIKSIAGNSGTVDSGDGGLATNASFKGLWAAAISPNDSNMVVSTWGRIRKINLHTGIVVTIAGNGTMGYMGDNGLAINAQVGYICGLIYDKGGNLYFSDINTHTVRKIDSHTGIISTIAGTGIDGNIGDGGQASLAQLSSPFALVFDSIENLYVSEAGFHASRIRRIDKISGIITTIAGDTSSGSSGDLNPPLQAKFQFISSMVFDKHGDMFVADHQDNVIRKIKFQQNFIYRVYGYYGASGLGYGGDGGKADWCKFRYPLSLYFDKFDNMLISDNQNRVIRSVSYILGDGNDTINTIAGNYNLSTYIGDSILATSAFIDNPDKIITDSHGNIYFTSSLNRVFKLYTKDTSSGINSIVHQPTNGAIIYPNPVTNYSIVKLKNLSSSIKSIEVMNTLGQQVFITNTSTNHGEVSLSTSQLSSGMYILKVKDNENNVWLNRFIKQ